MGDSKAKKQNRDFSKIPFRLHVSPYNLENEYLEIKISNSLHPIQGKWVFKLQTYGDKTIMTMKQYSEIDQYCKELEIDWFASCWDEASVDFIEQFKPPCYKIASASLTDDGLLRHHRKFGRPIILSTGMSTIAEIEHAIKVLGEDDLIVLHSTSTYPAQLEELNLKMIHTLMEKYDFPIGYSGHEPGLATTFAAAVMGASMVEKHITLDRSMWGSDQAASVEPQGITRLVEYISQWQNALGNGIKKVYESEIPIREKLRRKG